MSHGVTRKRESPEKEAARREKEKEQINDYQTLVQAVLARRAQNDYSKSAFDLTTTLLKKNPEFYTVWNYRRGILLEGLFKENPEGIRPLLLAELQFLFLRLREYPKCYWIWLYRKWCLEVCPDADWDTELKLVTKMLEADARNCLAPQTPPLPAPAIENVVDVQVHGWEYRRYVVASIERLRGTPLAKSEFEYTTSKTNNISNFSAWHNRANLVPKLLPPRTDANFETERKAFLNRELERTHNGLWVDPDDQSTWLYHSWLLGESFSLQDAVQQDRPILAPTAREEREQVLKSEIKLLEELLEEAPDSKWCLNFLSIYKISLARLQGVDVGNDVMDMISRLMDNDPMRKGMYVEWQRVIEARWISAMRAALR